MENTAKRLIVDDSIIVKGATCAAGSKMLANFCPPYQATAIDRALSAGYEIVGRADIDEFGLLGSGESCYNGPTTHPKDATRTASAAAAAVINGSADVAMITDSGPASRLAATSGCVAFRPTYGSVSRVGIIASVSSSEQISAVAADTATAADLIAAVAGHDRLDATSMKKTAYNYDCPASVEGKKYAIIVNELNPNATEQTMRALAAADMALREAGASVEPIALRHLDMAGMAYMIMSAAETCNNISRFDGVKYGYRAAEYSNIEELYRRSRSEAFGLQTKLTAMLGTHFLSKGNYEQYYYKALQVRRLLRNVFSEVFSVFDALLMPASATTAYPLGVQGQTHLAESDLFYTAPAAICGLPVAVLPWGSDEAGLPFALQVIAESNEDTEALRVAKVLEIIQKGGAC